MHSLLNKPAQVQWLKEKFAKKVSKLREQSVSLAGEGELRVTQHPGVDKLMQERAAMVAGVVKAVERASAPREVGELLASEFRYRPECGIPEVERVLMMITHTKKDQCIRNAELVLHVTLVLLALEARAPKEAASVEPELALGIVFLLARPGLFLS